MGDDLGVDPAVAGELGADRLAPTRSSPMNRQRSAGRDAQRERARARRGTSSSSAASATHRNSASLRSSVPGDDQAARQPGDERAQRRQLEQLAAPRRASSCAAASRRGHRGRAAWRRPAAAARRRGSPRSAAAALCGWTARPSATSAPRIAITSAASRARRKRASRRRLTVGPRESAKGLLARRPGALSRPASPVNPSGARHWSSPSVLFPVSTLISAPRLLACHQPSPHDGHARPNKCRDPVIASQSPIMHRSRS